MRRLRLLPFLFFIAILSSFAQVGLPQTGASSGRPQRKNPQPNRLFNPAARRSALRPTLAGVTPLASSVFLEAPIYDAGAPYTYSVAMADLNGDGKMDLVVANGGASGKLCDVCVLLGNGDGTFKRATSVDANALYAVDVQLADVNGDGKLDIVVTDKCFSSSNCNNGGVGVLLGNGDGTFQAEMIYNSGGYSPWTAAIGDVNGDGKADIVVANQCSDSNCTGLGSVGVLLGNGNGTFQAAVAYGSGGNDAFGVAVRDVNGDGKADIEVVNDCVSSSNCSNGIAGVLLGNGDGTFKAAVGYNPGGAESEPIAVADVNGDGKLDLVIGNECAIGDLCEQGGMVGILLGNGDGTFQPAVAYGSVYGGFVAVADMNGDGKLDIVTDTACDCEYGTVGVLLGNGDGTFQPVAAGYGSGGISNFAAAIGDLNGDGKLDVVSGNSCSIIDCSTGSDGSVGVLLGNGDGTFQSSANYPSAEFQPYSSAVADLNGDGKLDLLVENRCSDSECVQNSTVSVQLGNGNGTFQAAVNYSSGGYSASSMAVADVNGDGKADIVAANDCSDNSCPADGTVGVLLGNGDGTFQTAVTYDSGGHGGFGVAVGDINGDGKPDLIVTNYLSSTMGVLLGNGDGTFQTALTFSTGGTDPNAVAIADVNNDGKPDLLISNYCSTCTTTSTVSVMLGNGDGTFQPAVSYSSGGYGAVAIAVADLNADGKLDLVVANYCDSGSDCSNGGLGVLLGNGDGTFQAATTVATPTAIFGPVSQLVVADVNGDGKLDVASGAGDFLLLGNGDGTFQKALLLGAFGSALASGDFNGDGSPDLAVGDVTILLNRTPRILKQSTAALTFPTQLINTVSVGQVVTLTNTGAGAFKVKKISVTGAFSETNNCGGSIAAGKMCSVTVKFKPTTINALNGTLSISGGASAVAQTISLSGTGTDVQVAPTSLNFGGETVGSKSAVKRITMTNKGSVAVSITGISITGSNASDFAETTTCGKSLAAGANCSISVTFTPLATGVRSANVSVIDNGGGSPQVAGLSGTGD